MPSGAVAAVTGENDIIALKRAAFASRYDMLERGEVGGLDSVAANTKRHTDIAVGALAALLEEQSYPPFSLGLPPPLALG